MGKKKGTSKFEKKTYVITAAQGIQNPYCAEHYGKDSSKGKVNEPLLKNIERYVEDNGGKLKICAVGGSYVNEIELDKSLHNRNDVYMEKNAKGRLERQREREIQRREAWKEEKSYALDHRRPFNRPYPYHFFWDEIPETDYSPADERLNTNSRIFATRTPSQNKNPLTGKAVFTKKYGGNSIIIPGTKQHLEPVAIGQAGKFPRLMITTGAITKPNYNTTNDRGFLADEAHEYGFCVVDILDDKLYLPRLVPAQDNGTFIDLGWKYSNGKEPKKVKAHVLILGDAHASEIDPLTDKANDEMITYFDPQFIHIHDVFNSSCINLHEINDEIIETNKVEKGIDSLEEELILTGNYLSGKSKLANRGSIIVNYSNHDDMLYRWLAQGKYIIDKKNRRLAHKILGRYQKGDSILETSLKVVGKSFKKVRFLRIGEDAIYYGYQCGIHGHTGKNGARGNLKTWMQDMNIIIGHVHQLEIKQGSASVGTSSKIPLDYQLGNLSTAMAGNAVIYGRKLMQVIPIIQGKWKK